MGQKSHRFKGTEISITKSTEMVNIMEYQAPYSEVPRTKITVLVGSKAASTQDLEVPIELAEVAHNSGLFNC